ncbi:hypothetical protein [Paenibacillus soyae]|uniref:CDP-Glycerol:Poly(Glycerophosphate) glycerophosphotransferase n=1 Tax=Paenibacillus soyae TaxID=2969249 RepID=A0A9X2MTJ4_9BACL|nr:hypothetical protein [Paenibacillus soyae]MCR2806726.1 hypothetical protein [Paenibacillus soyae]
MRRYQQSQLLDLITTLYEATDEIQRQFSNQNIQVVINLLGDFQDAATHISQFIENVEGDDTRTVKLLTEFHQNLYNIAMEIENADGGFVKQIKKELRMIESGIRNELKPSKIEVAFFPYKASMWDALESIWLAAKEDPQCDAYVVPIPYYDRLRNLGLGQMHYEGDQYPDYVPIVDWQTYSLEEHRPDISFIHTGYDDSNIVTSVHPDYYSRNLKKHTELLCYSPYFVAANDVEEHLCTMPGVVHSDRVFVQSDKARNDYIHAIQAYEKKNNCIGRFGKVKEKIVASGSPKFDKVINSTPDDFDLPAEWKKRIENSDGSRKSIVLYNTSIGPILKENEKYIAKLRSVFQTFRNRDDVVLWWRPHPLSEATYSTMRPLLFEEYTQLIKEFKLEGYGIYDDTADLHRALRLSSAFYGDGTSILQLYQCMKKPVMVQNEQSNELLAIGSLYDTEEHLWFLTLHMNGLFRLNKKTRSVEFIGGFANEKPLDWRVYHTIHQSGTKLYFSPHSASAIAIYDLVEATFEYVELPLPKEKKYNDQSKFGKIIECDGALYFIPLHFPGIVKLSLEDNRTEIIDEWVKPIKKMICDPERGYFSNGFYNEGTGSLVLASANANAVMEFNLKDRMTKLIALNGDISGYSDILLIDEVYWLLALDKPVLISFSIDDRKVTEFEINLKGIQSDGVWPFQKLVHYNNDLYLVPADSKQMVQFDLTNHSFSYVDHFCPASLQEGTPSESIHTGYFFVSSNATDKIYITEKQSNQFIEYDLISGSLLQESLKVTDGLRDLQNFLIERQGIKCDKANSCAFLEHPYAAPLENLLDLISQPVPEPWFDSLLEKQVELRYAEISHPDGKAGMEIYEKAKKAVLKS